MCVCVYSFFSERERKKEREERIVRRMADENGSIFYDFSGLYMYIRTCVYTVGKRGEEAKVRVIR